MGWLCTDISHKELVTDKSGRLGPRWEEAIEVYLKETKWEGVYSIHLDPDILQRRVLLDRIINRLFHRRSGIY
jgi:hypothetical protein